jgi:protein disulfide-isomerase-like protein
MNSKLFLLYIFLLFLSYYSCEEQPKSPKIEEQIATDNEILVLTSNNFYQALSVYELVMVEFYSPQCGHCKNLEPEYTESALHFKEITPQIKFAKISCPQNRKFTDEFNITHYPTLLLFHRGEKIAEYAGERKAKDIITYMSLMQRAVMNPIESIEDIQLLQKELERFIIYFGDNKQNIDVLKSYSKINIMKNSCNVKEIMEHYKITPNSLVIFKEYDEKRNDLVIKNGNALTLDMVETFINDRALPVVKLMKYYLFLDIFVYDSPAVILYENSANEEECLKYEEIFREAARNVFKQLKDPNTDKKVIEKGSKLLFTKANKQLGAVEEQTFKFQNFEASTKFPAILIHDNQNNKEMFKFGGNFNVSELTEFIMKFLGAKLIPISFGDL